jgi:hypothetical protein
VQPRSDLAGAAVVVLWLRWQSLTGTYNGWPTRTSRSRGAIVVPSLRSRAGHTAFAIPTV